MSEYICFFHPRAKGSSPDAACPECGAAFGLPSEDPPLEVENFIVEKAIGRGFYSVAYLVTHRRTRLKSVLKVVPREVYEEPSPIDDSAGGFGNRRDFAAECALHASLNDVPAIVQILDWGDATVVIGGRDLPVYWMQLEYVDAPSLDIADVAYGPRTIAQIALDLLELGALLSSRGVFHNDLHPGNVALLELDGGRVRTGAVDGSREIKVFDLGSAARSSASNRDGRATDVERILSLVGDLLNRLDSRGPSELRDVDVRLEAQLRRLLGYYREADHRSVRPEDLAQALRAAYGFAVRPESRSEAASLPSVGAYVNAQTMPAGLARQLFISDSEPFRVLEAAFATDDPQVITGMRGCGKTMLLARQQWSAHVALLPGESAESRDLRLAAVPTVGLMVSCAHLIRGGEQRVGGDALVRLFLALAAEAVGTMLASEASGVGEIDFEGFRELLASVSEIAGLRLPDLSLSPVFAEAWLGRCAVGDIPGEAVDSFGPTESFVRLANCIRGAFPAWNARRLHFLVDDLSTRYVDEDTISRVLSGLFVKAPGISIKISTESQIAALELPGGAFAHEGRDFSVLDVGLAVLRVLQTSGRAFISSVLQQRLRAVGDRRSPEAILGRRKLAELAHDIAAANGRTGDRAYWGLDVLAGCCTGDLGDIVRVFSEIVADTEAGQPASRDVQSDRLRSLSQQRTMALVRAATADDWLYRHAQAFAAASHSALLASYRRDSKRLQQVTDLNIAVPVGDSVQMRRVLKLVEAGVYVLVGLAQRQRNKGELAYVQVRLRYRLLLGVWHGVPLSKRSRFELAESATEVWLENPTVGSFGSMVSLEPEFNDAAWVDEPTSVGASAYGGPAQTGVSLSVQGELDFGDVGDSARPRTSTSRFVASIEEVPYAPAAEYFADSVLIVAAGFEERAKAVLESMRSSGVAGPLEVIVLKYADHPDVHDVEGLARTISARVVPIEVDSTLDPTEAAALVVAEVGGRRTVVDVSAMSKLLIFSLVRELVTHRSLERVLHTSAATYWPSAGDLKEAEKHYQSGDLKSAIEAVDAAAVGEGSQFRVVPVSGVSGVDGLGSVLVAFVTLKYRRVADIVDALAPSEVTAIRTSGVTAAKKAHSHLAQLAANYVVGDNGSVLLATSLDAGGALAILEDQYRMHVLGSRRRLDIALTGTKLQMVAAGVFSSLRPHGLAFGAVPTVRDRSRYSEGTGETRQFLISVARTA